MDYIEKQDAIIEDKDAIIKDKDAEIAVHVEREGVLQGQLDKSQHLKGIVRKRLDTIETLFGAEVVNPEP